ncbi:hypothetical protein HQ865_13120 [Mucilaginibacter mali]|uniref:Uncharacterized protein n=1 Tax=Mucilaginibacter mali TaxID=2740462 RepID=A0A7D4TPC5_9SPHI|nr:hypothetical protein [Mucilaginibacter mali]QKJ30654.1 hypothetical protein HQ865_13120 [Mucilaginibacter mali]
MFKMLFKSFFKKIPFTEFNISLYVEVEKISLSETARIVNKLTGSALQYKLLLVKNESLVYLSFECNLTLQRLSLMMRKFKRIDGIRNILITEKQPDSVLLATNYLLPKNAMTAPVLRTVQNYKATIGYVDDRFCMVRFKSTVDVVEKFLWEIDEFYNRKRTNECDLMPFIMIAMRDWLPDECLHVLLNLQ